MRLLPILFVSAALATAWYEKDASTGILKELGPKLSQGARVVFQGEEGFEERIKRRQGWEAPDFRAIVDVKSEEDVQETVCVPSLVQLFPSPLP